MGITSDRVALRADIQARRQLLPELRAAIRTAKRRQRGRLPACRRIAASRRRKLAAAAKTAQRQLAARIARAKAQAKRTAQLCRTRTAPGELDRALAQLETERKTIKELQLRAGRRSERGRKGGQRAAELRAESDDQVRRDVADDPLLVAVWEKLKGKIKASRHMSRTEAFLHYVHNHPQALDEVRAAHENRWAREAEETLSALEQSRPGNCCDELERARAALQDVPF